MTKWKQPRLPASPQEWKESQDGPGQSHDNYHDLIMMIWHDNHCDHELSRQSMWQLSLSSWSSMWHRPVAAFRLAPSPCSCHRPHPFNISLYISFENFKILSIKYLMDLWFIWWFIGGNLVKVKEKSWFPLVNVFFIKLETSTVEKRIWGIPSSAVVAGEGQNWSRNWKQIQLQIHWHINYKYNYKCQPQL